MSMSQELPKDRDNDLGNHLIMAALKVETSNLEALLRPLRQVTGP
jgi:hypothetical protein